MSFSLGHTFKVLLILSITVLISQNLSAQSTGDYRSVASGDWTNISVWEVYNGLTWTAATTYPGQLTGTNDVYIEGGNSVTLTSDVPNTINSVTVGDDSGGLDYFYIGAESSLQTQLITLADGGWVEWIANKDFSLPSGAALVIETGGTLATGNPCNAAKRLIIGSTIYSTCNGAAGTDYSFDDLNESGGSISVSPSSNSPICDNETLNLYSNSSGAGADSATYDWSATGPSGYTYSSTSENPVINGLSAGSYTFKVTISDGTLTNSNSTSVTVNPTPSITLQPQDQVVFEGSDASFSVNQINGDSHQWEVSTDGGSYFATISDGSEYSGTQTENLTVTSPDLAKNGYIFRITVSNSTTGCGPISSNGANLTVKSGKVVTNRGITYRINRN